MADDHYFSAEPGVPSKPSSLSLALPDGQVTLQTDRGVFSGSRIDPGTKYLLSEAPAPAAAVRTALDLGCGYGPIAVTLARRAPQARVYAIDTNTRAVDLCTANASTLQLANVTATTPEALDASITFDLIWSNPPIRIGKAAMHKLLLQWLDRLNPAGVAILVVQKHLGSDSLQKWLIDQGWATERLGSRMGYRLLRVSSATPPPARPVDPNAAVPIRDQDPA